MDVIRKVSMVYEYLDTDDFEEHRSQIEYSGEWEFVRSWIDRNEYTRTVMYVEYRKVCK